MKKYTSPPPSYTANAAVNYVSAAAAFVNTYTTVLSLSFFPARRCSSIRAQAAKQASNHS
jgi:hypothetical protein